MNAQRPLAAVLAALMLTASAALAASATGEGVNVGNASAMRNLVPAETLEKQAQQQYAQLKRDAAQKNALAPDQHPQVLRLRRIARELIPFSAKFNPRARQWQWEVILLSSPQINAFCMPGGKIAFYTGILDKLQLTDDEVAMVMGHEIAHALREHARERVGKQAITHIGKSLLGIASDIAGFGSLGRVVIDGSGNLLTLKFSRDDESESDLIGMELAARAGYDPRAGVTLWQKMSAANKGAPPQWLSTHPSGPSRIKDIESPLPEVLPIYQKVRATAARPSREKPSASTPR